jgi:diadenosine tetraphosphate (Ap4A) HIT family hydrolase
MEIIDIYNNKNEVGCLGCAINSGEYKVPCGLICSTEFFGVNQDCEIPIPGFIIVSSKRHIHSIDRFTKEEQKDFISLIVRLRRGMREVLGINQIDIIVAELPGRREDHFHLWLYPVTKEAVEKFGTGIKQVKPMMNYAKENLKTPENIKKVEEFVEKLREYLKGS